jgi:hypothetical protein
MSGGIKKQFQRKIFQNNTPSTIELAHKSMALTADNFLQVTNN